VAVVLRCNAGDAKQLRGCGSTRGCSWRRRFPPADGNRGESTRITAGGYWPASSSGGGARRLRVAQQGGMLGRRAQARPRLYRAGGGRGLARMPRPAAATAWPASPGRWAMAGPAGPERSGCDRTAQNNSVLSPKPVRLAIKQ
jgi:hypothetical protein